MNRKLYESIDQQWENYTELDEIDFKSEAEFQAYKKEHDLRPGTKVNIAGKGESEKDDEDSEKDTNSKSNSKSNSKAKAVAPPKKDGKSAWDTYTIHGEKNEELKMGNSRKLYESISKQWENYVELDEIDFKDQAEFDAYKEKHKMRDTTKVRVGGKDTTAGKASGKKKKPMVSSDHIQMRGLPGWELESLEGYLIGPNGEELKPKTKEWKKIYKKLTGFDKRDVDDVLWQNKDNARISRWPSIPKWIR